ncbi:mechanosensitive ion channel family protein [Fibrobacterota bacterium]
MQFLEAVHQVFAEIKFGIAIRLFILVAVGLPSLFFFSALTAKLLKNRVRQQTVMVLRKLLFYAGVILLVITIFRELGFSLTAVMGTAGVVGIAVGFASQTSLSNLISGFFLIGEKPFEIGDLIRVGDRVGVAVSIDLLSIKIRTMDNLFVRLPNENLIKQEVVNITRYPIRRMDLNIGVAYKESPERVIKVLKDIARKNLYCLDEPEALVLFKSFGDSALEFLFGVWFVKTDYLALRNSIMTEIKLRFDEEGIEIPFPHRTIYIGSDSQPPFPVSLQNSPSDSSQVTQPEKPE